jgi:hypothetical protein
MILVIEKDDVVRTTYDNIRTDPINSERVTHLCLLNSNRRKQCLEFIGDPSPVYQQRAILLHIRSPGFDSKESESFHIRLPWSIRKLLSIPARLLYSEDTTPHRVPVEIDRIRKIITIPPFWGVIGARADQHSSQDVDSLVQWDGFNDLHSSPIVLYIVFIFSIGLLPTVYFLPGHRDLL